jgi:DNA-binding CsgD family transcriptional regulator
VRAGLHLQAARALAGAGAGVEKVAEQLAADGEAGGGAGEAGPDWVGKWLVEQAPVLAYQAPAIAAQLLRQVLAHAGEGDQRREVLETALVTVAFLLSDHQEVERVARPLLVRTASPGTAAEVSWLLAYSLMYNGRAAEAAEVEEAALARPGTSPAWAARLHALHATTLCILGQLDRVERAAGEAMTAAEQAGDRLAAGYALQSLVSLEYSRRNHVAMLAYSDRALAVIGDDPQTAELRILLLSNRAGMLADQDRHGEALADVREALALTERSGTARRLGVICASAAERYFEVGQWDDALAMQEMATGLPGPERIPIFEEFPVLLHGTAALIAAHRDDWDTVGEHLAAVDERAMDSASLQTVAYSLLRARALAAEQAGRPMEAVAVLAACLDPAVAEVMGERYLLLPPLARVALAAGDAATVAAAAGAAEQEGAREPLPVKAAAADVCRGLAAGDPAPLLAAAAYYQRVGRPLDWAHALEDAAVLLAGRGDLAAARAAFRDAARAYQDLGADWDLRRADARLRGYGIRRGRGGRRPRAVQGWDALTPTEAKIVSLVAEGRSNPDIAADLHLSRNTVQTHVSHVLAKLGAHSRAEIIRQALEHTGHRTVG